jgi:glutaredoxin 2
MNNSEKTFPGHELFYFASCPFCIKAIAAMKWMGIKIPMKNIKKDPANKAELVSGGGKKQVPCLKISDAKGVRWLYESNDIIKYFKQAQASKS